jgi:hypothetical protein
LLYETGYKKSWYNENGESSLMTIEDFKDDFAIIEKIIETTGSDKNEGFTCASMFPNIIEKVQQQFVVDHTLEDCYPSNNEKRDGLRTLLFMVCQMCTIAYSSRTELDLKVFWKTMNFYVQKERRQNWQLCVYGQVFHQMMTLTVGFLNEPVSINIID